MTARESRLGVFWDIWRIGRSNPPKVADRQQQRLTELVAFARNQSSFYASHYEQLPQQLTDFTGLPPVTKPQLMAHFDEWVTDPAVQQAGIDAFTSDKTNIGHLYQGRYAVWETGGTTGEPAVFLHDQFTRWVYSALNILRGPTANRQLRNALSSPGRFAWIGVTDTHHSAVSRFERLRQKSPIFEHLIRPISVQRPPSKLVAELNDYQPDALAGYPSILRLLAREQQAGRLQITPTLVVPVSETLSAAARTRIETAFNTSIRQLYAASECPIIAAECPAERLHANTDWFMLEPVDDEYQPVSPGESSHTVLLTNLANRIQPLIRYDLGDRLTIVPQACPCGSPLPIITVKGRQDDLLFVESVSGEEIPLSPLALESTVESVSHVRRFQVTQTGPATLRVRIEEMPDTDLQTVQEGVRRALRDYLTAQGLEETTIEWADEPPQPDPDSGKFRSVLSEL